MAAIGLKTKQDLRAWENHIFDLLGNGVNVYFVPLHHHCNRQMEFEQLFFGTIPGLQLIFISRRLHMNIYYLFNVFKMNYPLTVVDLMKCPICFRRTIF